MYRKLLTNTLKTEEDVSISAHRTTPILDLSLTGERAIDFNFLRNIRRNFHENPSIGPDF
jgi:hypothetical protein